MTSRRASKRKAAAPFSVEAFCAPERRKYILVAAILASALGFIDGTVVAIAIPAMRATLGASLAQAQWVHNAYMLTLSALILVGGAAGDRFGLARVFGLGIATFVVASLLCAVAPHAGFLIVMRAIQGIGAAIMVPGSLALIARAYPEEDRGRAIGIWAAASALTTALGPVVGGLALSLGGPDMWRWIFAVNLPLGGLALYLLRAGVQADPARPDTPIDYAGAGLITAALMALAWGLTSLQHGATGHILMWIFAGTGLLFAFLMVEARTRHPMMPLGLFAIRNFWVVNLICFTLYGALNIILFFLPMTLIAGWGMSAIWAAAAFAPLSLFVATLSARMGALADTIGPRPVLATGCFISALGYALLAQTTPQQEYVMGILPAMGVIGVGMAVVVAPISSAVMAAVSQGQTGIASGVNNAVTRLAGLIWVAAMRGVAAQAYLGAGGLAVFGLPSDTAGHAEATTAALILLSWVAAALCAFSAALALMVTPKPQGKAKA